jgi:hypothetical protein
MEMRVEGSTPNAAASSARNVAFPVPSVSVVPLAEETSGRCPVPGSGGRFS